MEIDNSKMASRVKMLLISIPFILLCVSSLLALFLVIFTWIPTFISGGLVLLGWLATVVLKLSSLKFRFTEKSLILFFYPISPMTSNFRKIEISAGKLSRYEIVRSSGGLRKELVLYENIGGQEASYPPVSIMPCSKETLRRIEESLSAYSTGTSS